MRCAEGHGWVSWESQRNLKALSLSARCFQTVKDVQELHRMRDQGGADSGPRQDKGGSQGCLPLGGRGAGAWRDREDPDGRRGFVVRMHTVLSWVAGTHRADVSAFASKCSELSVLTGTGRHAACRRAPALGPDPCDSCPSSMLAG